ncbi:MAG: hypothetical protein AMXMBFR83_02710 [Phycisphaerae bacterium]
MVLSGRMFKEQAPGADERVPLTGVLCLGGLDGSEHEPAGFRTWETEPAGWYRLSGSAGRYTLLFTAPAHFVRPYVLTNVYTRPGEKIERPISPDFDAAVFRENAWDPHRASHYYQLFVARSTSVTHVGFKLAHDGVDGGGPGAQDLVLSIHRQGPGSPDTWEQVGPGMIVPRVDCGGPKGYSYSAGWNSGEVPTQPGAIYAVHLRAQDPAGTFQAFWSPHDQADTDCYRVGSAGTTGFQRRHLWMAVDGDGDGLLIPYNKRIHREFGDFAGGGRRWAQTYVARGRGLAGVVMYAAVGTAEPPLSRQRCRVRVREGGPGGPRVGIDKIAVGNGNYTGDASWGVFAAVYAPGEVPLVPGRTYAIEFESIENHETLHGFINIKNVPSTERPGFNPYRKVPPDAYEQGTAFADAGQPVDFDLDMQIVEYEHAASEWALAVEPVNLLKNGDMEAGMFKPDGPETGRCEHWRTFAAGPATVLEYRADSQSGGSRFLRVRGGGPDGGKVDGGYVQRVEGLSRTESYRLNGRIRCSWPLDVERSCAVGVDATGQTTDPDAATVVWTHLPPRHGVWLPYAGEPVRPADQAVSIWLRGKATAPTPFAFKADFDDFRLQRVSTTPPRPMEH